jgi:acyl-CoA reductase-like NAD-dependent aldehyde dehydrogenase
MWMHPVAIATGKWFLLKPSESGTAGSHYIGLRCAVAGMPAGEY